ncbi:MAG TPA: InlB B-repeat-containing protein, partial [Acidimicrobiales bacterium]|nr:InlB B-repeat-containing protein [Acidimicrobiales bacterium]
MTVERFLKLNSLAKVAMSLSLVVAISLIAGSAASMASGTYVTAAFAENASPSDLVYAQETQNTPSALTLFSALSPTLVKSGYSFVGWNTQPDGSGVAYADGAMYDFASPLTLYAVWNLNTQSVMFEENASTSDTVAFVQR